MYLKLSNYLAAIDQKTFARYGLYLLILLSLTLIAINISEGVALLKTEGTPNIKTKTSPPPSERHYSASIVSAAWFGNAADSQLSDIQLPQTKLQLTLRGAFTASDPKKASAIIEDADKVAKHYKVGSLIFGQTHLKAVYDDRVILSTNENLETLYFPIADASSLTDYGSATDSSSNSTPIMDEERKKLIQQRLEELRKRVKR